jgi:hypothetical protein
MYAIVHACTHTHALRDEVKSLGSATDHRRHRRHRDGHHAEAYHPLDSPVNLPSDRTPSPLIIPDWPSAVQRLCDGRPTSGEFCNAQMHRSACARKGVPGCHVQHRDATLRRQILREDSQVLGESFRTRVALIEQRGVRDKSWRNGSIRETV